jgi:aminopyrrolnitrin oxygenase
MSGEQDSVLRAPVTALPPAPAGWTFFCRERDLKRGPVACTYLDRRLVAFQTASGRAGILNARCQHLGADLARGRVVNECLECPYHHWQYAVDGQCKHLPQSTDVPSFARQKSYPVAIRNGLVFLWNGPRALYPLPFFEGLDPEKSVCAGPMTIDLDCPWYIVGANSFDSQHLYSVHERVLQEPPQVRNLGDFALESQTVAKVDGRSWYDRFVRLTAGNVSAMTATNWSGSLIFVRVKLKRAATYGMVSLRPMGEGRVLVHVFAFLERSNFVSMRKTWDVLRTAVRLYLIGQFLRDDAVRLRGIRPGTVNLIEADQDLGCYFQWLARTANGLPAKGERVSRTSTHYQGAER